MNRRLKSIGLRISRRLLALTLLTAVATLLADSAASMRVETSLTEGKLYQGQTVCLTVKFYSSSPDIEFVDLYRPFEVGGLTLLRVRRANTDDGMLERKGKGKNEYQAVVYRAMLLVNDADEVEIPSIDFSVGIPGYTTYDHPFYGNVRQKYVDEQIVSTKPLKRKVSRLPAEPETFTGAIGDFTIEGSVPPGEIYSGGTALVQFRIKGTGLLEEDDAPDVRLSLPSGITLKSQTAETGSIAEGDKLRSELVADCHLSVPEAGEFVIAPVKFTFFDPASRRYRTVESKSLTIKVEETEIPSGPVILHSI